jgi:hypothetical protein
MATNFKDFYILNTSDPTFTEDKLIEDNIINVILQKYKMVIFTNKGDLMGDPDFGADIELLLYETLVASTYVQKIISDQITKYIPELINMEYTLNILFTKAANNIEDIMFIQFGIKDYMVYAQFGKSIN